MRSIGIDELGLAGRQLVHEVLEDANRLALRKLVGVELNHLLDDHSGHPTEVILNYIIIILKYEFLKEPDSRQA